MVYHEFVESCFSHSTENFRRGTFCLWEKFWYRKFWRIRGGYHLLPSKIFWYRKILCRRGGSRFCVAIFLSHSTEKVRRGILVFQKNCGLKKLHKVVYHDFVGNWFSHSSKKFRRRTLLFSENFLFRKFLWIGKGYHDFLWKVFCLTVPKKLPKRTLWFQKTSEL